MALSAAEKAEMAQLEKEVGEKVSGGLSSQEQAELNALENEFGAGEKKHEPGAFGKALDYGVRTLDYPGGFMRAGLANAAGLIGGRTDVVKPEDLSAAARGQGPTSSEYLERLGVPEGPSANLPFVGKTSLRDAEGFALDVATDPLTMVAKGAKALGRAAGLINPVSAATEKAGTAIYKSGLKKVDERLAEKGAGPLSDLLLQEGKFGTTKTLANDAKSIGAEANAKRAALYQKASDAGVKIDMSSVLNGAEAQIAKIKSDPGLAPMAEKLEELVTRYKSAGPVDLATASQWKTNLANALPEAAYAAHGKIKNPAQQFQKALAGDFRTAIIESGNKAEKGLGDQIGKLNETMETVLEAKKPLAMQVRRAETPSLFSSIDGLIGGYGIHDPATAAGILAVKKGADLAKTTAARTSTGLGLIKAAETGAPDILLKRSLINANKPVKGPLDEEELNRLKLAK